MLAAVAVVVPVGAALVGAGDPQGGLWYYNDSGMATIHQTTTGEGITIAVLDSPLNPDTPDLAGLDIATTGACATEPGGPVLPSTATDESAIHGTGIVAYIVGTGAGVDGQPGVLGVAPGATVHHYNATNFVDGCAASEAALDGTSTLIDALDDGANIVNMSFGGAGGSTHVPVDDIPRALARGAILVGASPNQAGAALDPPAAYNGVVSVAAIGPDGARSPEAATGEHLGVLAPGDDMLALGPGGQWTQYGMADGSSGATAYTSAALALVWSRYPDATANQVLQSLARNTGSEDHPLTHDAEHGYGVVNVRHMLEHDPTEYPDENPFLWDDPGEYGPTKQDVLAAAEQTGESPSGAATPGTGSTDDPQAEPDESSSLPWVAIGVGALLVVAVVVVVLLVVRRRPGGSPGGVS